MTAGIPGIGIGWVFYMTGVTLMPFVEIGNTVRRRSSWKRWRLIGKQMFYALSITGSFWVIGEVLGRMYANFGAERGASKHLLSGEQAFMSFFILAAVIIGLSVYNFVLNKIFAVKR